MSFFKVKFLKREKSLYIFSASVIMGLAVVIVFCLEAYSSYKSEIRSAENQAHNLSQVLEEQLLSSIKKIDLVLLDLQDGFQHKDGVHQYNADMIHFMRAHRARLPEVYSLKYFNEKGDLIINDIQGQGALNIADRDFFKFYKKTGKDMLYITPPIKGRIAPSWIVVLSRPIFDEKNQLKGVITASMQMEYFKNMLINVNIGEKGSIALFGFDGMMYARVPDNKGMMGTKLNLAKTTKAFIVSDKKFTSYQDFSSVDGYEKIYSTRKIAEFPLFFAVGLSTQEILNSWKNRTILYVVFLTILFVTFSGVLLMYLRSVDTLEEQRKLAIQSAKLTTLGEMASNIAHEINNPLTVISTLAMITKFPEELNEREKRFNVNLDKIIQTVDRIAKIIQSLRTFSRDSYDDPILPTSLQSIFNTTFELCLQRLKNNQVEVELIPFEDKMINCREYQIVQVLMNLLNNSLDALDGQKEKRIIISVEDCGKKMKILVQDNGPKIPDDVAERMMNPFFTTKEMGKGTGLGLSISKGIIENHKGEFYLDRSRSSTTFVIELPKSELN